MLGRYQRRTGEVDEAIVASYVNGLSTRRIEGGGPEPPAGGPSADGCRTGWSFGYARVAVPAYACDPHSDERLEEEIPKVRAEAVRIVQAVHSIRDLAVQMYAVMGLELEPK